MTLLVAEGLGKRYGRVRALQDFGLEVAAGEVVGLLGPNGAGKSTAFRILAGLERSDTGRVQLNGRAVERWPLHRRARLGLGFLPQHPSVLPRLTARENLVIAIRRVAAREIADSLLAELGLTAQAETLAGKLSGGERRRLEVARCLALEPAVMLLDEPFAGVDPAHVEDLATRIRALAHRGVGIVLTDHAVREAMSICDRVVILDGGIIQIEGLPEVVAADERTRARYLGTNFALPPRNPL